VRLTRLQARSAVLLLARFAFDHLSAGLLATFSTPCLVCTSAGSQAFCWSEDRRALNLLQPAARHRVRSVAVHHSSLRAIRSSRGPASRCASRPDRYIDAAAWRSRRPPHWVACTKAQLNHAGRTLLSLQQSIQLDYNDHNCVVVTSAVTVTPVTVVQTIRVEYRTRFLAESCGLILHGAARLS
jgi:hypothetical protein